MDRGPELAAWARAVRAERARVLGHAGESCGAGQRGMGHTDARAKRAGASECGHRRAGQQR